MIALIGAGPVGIEMAVALQKAGLAYVHLEAGAIGATMGWWAPGTRWFSSNERIAIAGVPLVTAGQEKATREEYLAYLRGVVGQFGLAVETYREVVGIGRVEGRAAGGFELRVKRAMFERDEGEVVGCEKIILATGGTAVPNMLGVAGEELGHVSHYFRDPHGYFGKRVVIVGGRNSAVEAALRCHRAGAAVTVVHKGAEIEGKDIKYWLWPEFASLVKSGGIGAHFGMRVEEIMPGAVRVRGEGGVRELGCDFVLLMTGYRADMRLARMAGVELRGEEEVPAVDGRTMETNVSGVYMVGTAVAGTQRRYKVFLENCHVHVGRVVAHLKGERAPEGEGEVERAEGG